jgi:hypothetical protein
MSKNLDKKFPGVHLNILYSSTKVLCRIFYYDQCKKTKKIT